MENLTMSAKNRNKEIKRWKGERKLFESKKLTQG